MYLELYTHKQDIQTIVHGGYYPFIVVDVKKEKTLNDCFNERAHKVIKRQTPLANIIDNI